MLHFLLVQAFFASSARVMFLKMNFWSWMKSRSFSRIQVISHCDNIHHSCSISPHSLQVSLHSNQLNFAESPRCLWYSSLLFSYSPLFLTRETVVPAHRHITACALEQYVAHWPWPHWFGAQPWDCFWLWRTWKCDRGHIRTQVVSVISGLGSPSCSSFWPESGRVPHQAAPLPCPWVRKTECKAQAAAVSSILTVCTNEDVFSSVFTRNISISTSSTTQTPLWGFPLSWNW